MTPEIRLRFKKRNGTRYWRATLRDADSGGCAPVLASDQEHLSPTAAVGDLVNAVEREIGYGRIDREFKLFGYVAPTPVMVGNKQPSGPSEGTLEWERWAEEREFNDPAFQDPKYLDQTPENEEHVRG